jgi:hypothetical protein
VRLRAATATFFSRLSVRFGRRSRRMNPISDHAGPRADDALRKDYSLVVNGVLSETIG